MSRKVSGFRGGLGSVGIRGGLGSVGIIRPNHIWRGFLTYIRSSQPKCNNRSKIPMLNLRRVNIHVNTGWFEMIVGVSTTCHLVLQMQPYVNSFCGVTSSTKFMFLLFPPVSRNWRYESEPPLKPSLLACYKQVGTNSIIVLMFVESQRVHI